MVDDSQIDETCYICGGDDNQMELLVCDRCNFHVCHVHCDSDIRDGQIPDGDWYCHFCRGDLFSDGTVNEAEENDEIDEILLENESLELHH